MVANPYEPPGTTQEPGEGERRQSWLDWSILVLALLGTAHFTVSVLAWTLLLYVVTDKFTAVPGWEAVLGALPAVVLLVLFAVSALWAWRRVRRARYLLAAAVVLAIACFVFDAVTRNCQMHVEWTMADSPPPFVYFTWWWYDERWFR